MVNNELDKKLSLACSALLITVVQADDVVEEDELHMAQQVISDFFLYISVLQLVLDFDNV